MKQITTYYVIITTMDLRNGEIHIYYIGKDGYVHDDPRYVTGWRIERFAKECIKNDMKYWARPIGIGELSEYNCIMQENYVYHYEIASHTEELE